MIFLCRFEWWLPAITFSLLIFLYDEARKYIIRKYPGGMHTPATRSFKKIMYVLFFRMGRERNLLLNKQTTKNSSIYHAMSTSMTIIPFIISQSSGFITRTAMRICAKFSRDLYFNNFVIQTKFVKFKTLKYLHIYYTVHRKELHPLMKAI